MEVTNSLYKEGSDKILQGLLLFDLEWENIRSAQAWAIASSKLSKEAMQIVMDYPGAGAYCLDLRLHPRQKLAWLTAAAAAARSLGNKVKEGLRIGDLGVAYYSLGDAHNAIECFEQELVIVRESGDRRNEGSIFGNLGAAYDFLNETGKAIEFYEKHLAIASEIRDREGQGASLFNMGLALYGLGEKESAIDLVKRALKFFESIESTFAERARNALKVCTLK